ncbi:ArsR/SmtB family transcription factor [Sphingobacterium spiritivorum]|uniref:HTH arsR-type domain-containing protein n=1 Tax=Sphingobacterium spiritivorum ATCC 33861 TaxID=525373 RepID=D7VS60_SPHSI|nr:metalloregulator ArsR/SmtB family transcription factor [Sphingobacterium spiritivorum]EFK56611.1 hypothetical protein HMPREF0766_13814 [Sphingobacterium spiritivorum ATCC 33861]WQD32022.1 metalloregulator ArsR/SmtB family transcription factor [Sphingobacterium spiritivorum]SUJ04971.1 DNA-binding transcriptional repressor ArsR [Sphingobacterium spiritivorum]
MDYIEIFKALSNKGRFQILQWLKDPEAHFPYQEHADLREIGVCVGQIQRKSGLTQSTVSEYLAIMQKANLVHSVKIGQWIYYKRNEEILQLISNFFKDEL